MLDSERTFLKVSESFRNFVYVSNYVHLKSFPWKRDCLISSKLQTKVIQGHSTKLL